MFTVKYSKSAYGTTDVVLYNGDKKPNFVMWFALMDIWGSNGYDRFNDGGMYFELPGWVYDKIDDFPFTKGNHEVKIIRM